MEKQTKVSCPTCNKEVVWNIDAKWRPFCSDRCRLIDLGEWFAEEHRLASEEQPLSDELGEH